jgi:pimeloyl-ACP methyl ester carboxylesterase
MNRRMGGLGLLMVFCGTVVVAAEPFTLKLPDSLVDTVGENWEMQTLGGRQFWGDVQFFHGWRIQRNVFTGHYRLLDEKDRRHASGSLADCQDKLQTLRAERGIPEMSGRGVILLHGIVRSSKSIYKVADQLRAEGFAAFPMEYPSTQISIPEAADHLDSVIRNLEGIEELHLVGHSMGGLVIRAWFDRHGDPRVKRVVMLGTPNYGAELADYFKRNVLFRTIFGPAGRQLVTDDAGLIPKLPIPPVEFAVIAGGRGDGKGWNPLIPGDDDGTVTVQSVKLAGAADSSVIPVLHHALLGDAEVARQTARFLKTGALREGGGREPVTITKP